MFRSRWLRNLLHVAHSRKDWRRLRALSRKPVRLVLESLEERLTPSGGNPTVTQTAGGYTALTAAVKLDTASNTSYVIQITNNFTFNSGGQVNISKLGTGSTLNIEGQNGAKYTLTGNGNRLFAIGSGQNVTFADLTLTGGVLTNSSGNAQGGAIYDVGGNVTLSAVNVQDNSVMGSLAQGGGIYLSGGGYLTIKNGCGIQSNNATGASFAEGGGVYVSGASTVAISDSILSKNSVTGEQGANGTSPGANGSDGGTAYGGGLCVFGSGWTVTFIGDTFAGNTAISGNGGNGAAGQNASGTNANGGNGGEGGWVTGGGASFFVGNNGSGHLTILDDPNASTTNPSEFLDNSIQSGAGGNGGDGGTSTGTGNNSNGGNGGNSNQAVGGALFIQSAAGGTITATLSNTIFSGNKVSGAKGGAGGAAGAGGTGSAGVVGTTPGGSSAVGGGIGLENSVVATINNCTVANNTAAASSGVNDVAQGGGIGNFGGTLTLTKVAVRSNAVTGTAAQGGGILVSRGGNLAIHGGSVIQSNRATAVSTASGGGVYVAGSASGSTTINIRDSILSNNSAQGEQGANGTGSGANGGDGGEAQGGGLFVTGSDWKMTLTGVTLLGNSAVGGSGGNGAAGSNATGANATGGNGGNGGGSGGADGGAAYIVGDSSCTLNILDDPTAPSAYPSIMIDNLVRSGAGGNGGAGGASTGTATNSNGGDGGYALDAEGGALFLGFSNVVVTIGNTTFYGNKVLGGDAGSGGAAGIGGSGTTGKAGANPGSYFSSGGGLDLEGGNITLVNNTVAKNTVTAGTNIGGTGSQGEAIGGGILIENFTAATFDNNTITQNTVSGGIQGLGSGIYDASSNLALLNNLIQGNQSLTLPANALETGGNTLANASNNFITSVSANAVSPASNIIDNGQTQLGSVVGADSSGKPTGGPIYYPLLSGTVSIGAGSTSTLSSIASIEGTTATNATDEIGNPRSNNGSIDLGAIQLPRSSPPPSPSPSPSPTSPPAQPAPPVLIVPPLLALLDSLLGGTETVNANGTETITDSIFGIPLIVATFNSSGNLESVTLFGFNITFLFG